MTHPTTSPDNTASRAALERRLHEIRQAISNYEELSCDIDDPSYVARGNGFCDAKYSEDFLEGQLTRLRQEEKEVLEKMKQKP